MHPSPAGDWRVAWYKFRSICISLMGLAIMRASPQVATILPQSAARAPSCGKYQQAIPAGSSGDAQLGMLCTNHRGVCICGLGRSAALQILAIATAMAAVCARGAAPLQPIPIRSAHTRSIRAEHP